VCTLSQYRTKLLLLSHNFSNVMINNTRTNEAHYGAALEPHWKTISQLLPLWANLSSRGEINDASVAKATKENAESENLEAQSVGMYQNQKSGELKATQIVNLNGPGPSGSEPVVVYDVPVKDAVEQLQLQVQVVQSHFRPDAAYIDGTICKYYEDNYQWLVANCSPDGWKYVMDMPAVYSLVRPDGQQYEVMLTEETNPSKAGSGYATSAQAHFSFSFKKKFQESFKQTG
jgi:hypothetical protein